jgi:hydroxymethylpyrimidine pyrophosphatase-like HAD family hydrolase
MSSVTEQELIKLGEKYLLECEIKRKRVYAFYQTVKDNPEYKEQARQKKNEYYIQNRDRLRERDKLRYQNDIEFKEGLKHKYKERKQKEIDEMITRFYLK